MKKLLFLSLLFLITTSAFGVELESSSVFEGDRYGEFGGDLVAHLSDGSSWKVHPTQSEIYSLWEPGDTVHVEVRTDWYWFSRQHKFLLVNEAKNENIKVMIVGYPTNPLKVVDVDTVISHTIYTYTNNVPVPHPVYRTKIKLSDGTSYFTSKRVSLGFGDYVYYCTGYGRPCLIWKNQRSGRWIELTNR